jgi:hypothetical protein
MNDQEQSLAARQQRIQACFRDGKWNADELANLCEVFAREAEMLTKYKQRMEWLHDCSGGQTDPEGCEWGIYRVKWENGRAVAVWQTNGDFSDLDAEMAREKAVTTPTPAAYSDFARKVCARLGDVTMRYAPVADQLASQGFSPELAALEIKITNLIEGPDSMRLRDLARGLRFRV